MAVPEGTRTGRPWFVTAPGSVCLVGAVLLVLAACAGPAAPAHESGSPTHSAATEAPASTSSSAPPSIAGDYELCTTLLDARTVERYIALGYSPWGASFEKKIIEESAGNPASVSRFVEYGGVVCAWGGGADEASVLFAYGPISSEVAEKERANIAAQGSKRVEATFERYSEPEGYDGGYAFGDGYWAYALDNGGGDVLAQIVANAPAF